MDMKKEPNFREDLLLALSSLSNPPRNATATVTMKSGGKYSYSYSDLDSILDLARPILAANNFVILSEIGRDEGGMFLSTKLLHVSGSAIASVLPLADMPNVQELGARITYLRRYAITALLGICSSSDDESLAQVPDAKEAKIEPRISTGKSQHIGDRLWDKYRKIDYSVAASDQGFFPADYPYRGISPTKLRGIPLREIPAELLARMLAPSAAEKHTDLDKYMLGEYTVADGGND